MAYPALPSEYSIQAGKRLLKTALPEVSDHFRGITPDETIFCAEYAWAIVISRFAGFIDIGSWDTNPPPLIRHIWEFFASAQYLRMVSRDLEVDSSGGGMSLIRSWESWANKMIRNVLDPEEEGERLSLMDIDGNIIQPRTDVAVPEVRSSGSIFFPNLATDTFHDGLTVSGSVEEIFRQITMPAQTG